eukprot:scaffold141677_cov15-Tisochrysis_lutea.AAC.1
MAVCVDARAGTAMVMQCTRLQIKLQVSLETVHWRPQAGTALVVSFTKPSCLGGGAGVVVPTLRASLLRADKQTEGIPDCAWQMLQYRAREQ